MKITQDFLGAENRLRSKSAEFADRVDELMSHWRDATAADFKERQLAPVSETLRRLMLTLQEAAELAVKMDKVLREDGAC